MFALDFLPVLRLWCVIGRPSHYDYIILQVHALGESNNFCKHSSTELVYPGKHEETLMKDIRKVEMWLKRKLSTSHLNHSEDVI